MMSFLFQMQLMPEQASSFSQEIDLFYVFLIVLTAVFSLGIAAVGTYFMIRYRRRSHSEIPAQIDGDMRLELTWTIIPFLISMLIFAWGAKIYYQIYRTPKENLEIFITGKQWMWRAQHPDGQREINALHVPLGRRVKLTMTSEDVIHAYYIPAFRTKADVVPGRYTNLWFEPTKVGTYHLFCAEYCGTKHSGMIGTITVQEPADFQAWLNNTTRDTSPAVAGGRLFSVLGCASCHAQSAQARGPSLEGIYGKQETLDNGQKVLVDDAYIHESILQPNAKRVAAYEAVMPTFQGQVNEEQISELIAYIKSIGPQQTDKTTATAPGGTSPANVKPGVGESAQPVGPTGKPAVLPQPARSQAR